MTLFSTDRQLQRIGSLITKFTRLPFAPNGSVPGAVLEAILAEVREARTLKTYDFVDVVDDRYEVGWQIKSTKASTPVTWKRAKIPNQLGLIDTSRMSPRGAQQLGDAIMEFCNAHTIASLRTYGLREIGYARLVIQAKGKALYFERRLITQKRPQLFNPKAFSWRWSDAKETRKKEQLSALHGTHIPSGRKWWAWHGLGENQLHFSGESAWWPQDRSHAIEFSLPSLIDRMTMQDLVEMLDGKTP